METFVRLQIELWKATGLFIFLLGLLLSSCAPTQQTSRTTTINTAFTAADRDVGTQMLELFPSLKNAGVSLTSEEAFSYVGTDQQAFLVAIDQFYLKNPGFCPVENAFFYAGDRPVYLTLAAKPAGKSTPASGVEVRAFIYDQSEKPNFIFAFLTGKSLRPIVGRPCRTAPR